MADQKPETMAELKDELADIDKRAEKLEAELKEAEAKAPHEVDHADDGGVI